MTGGFLGTFIHAWFPASTASSGAYALVTMGAVVAAATHAPITAIIMIFELTQTINIIPPLMAACVVSTLVTTFASRDSIYTKKLRRRGIDLFEEESHNILKRLRVHDIVDQQPEILQASDNFQTVVERVLASEHTRVLRRRPPRAICWAPSTCASWRAFWRSRTCSSTIVVAEDLLEPDEPTVTDDDDLDLVMQLFGGSLRDEIGVVAWDDPRKLVGSIHKKDVLHAYNREVMRRDMAGSVSSTVLVASKGQQVEIGGGYVLQEIQPPPRYFGRTIRELDIGAETGVQIILLRKRAPGGGSQVRVPTANDRIDEGDRLVVAGTKSAVEAMDVIWGTGCLLPFRSRQGSKPPSRWGEKAKGNTVAIGAGSERSSMVRVRPRAPGSTGSGSAPWRSPGLRVVALPSASIGP